MTFFLLDERNIVLGVFTEGINQIPAEAIQVSDEIAQQKLNDETALLNCYKDGKLINKDIRTPEEIEQQRKQIIQSQIDILEAKAYRPLREMQVGTEEEMLQASIILGELNEQIKTLRGQL